MSVKALLKTRSSWQLLVVGCVSFLVVWLYLVVAFSRLEWMLLDKRMDFYSKDTEISSQIATVMIDESSLRDMNAEFGRFPVDRIFLVRFDWSHTIDRLSKQVEETAQALLTDRNGDRSTGVDDLHAAHDTIG